MDERATETPNSLAEALPRALAYLEIHGDDFDRARVGAASAKIEPPIPQNPDGGWPSGWSGGASSVFGTCQVLDLLAGLDPVGVDQAAGLAFLAAMQSADGTWSEPPGAPGADVPEWLLPGSSSARAYLTAYCARVFLVCGAGQEGPPHDAVERAAQALEWSLDPHGRLPGPLTAHWLAARVFRATDRQLPARRLLDVVGRQFDQLEVAELASFGADVDPGDRWAKRIAARLLALQEADGSWSAEGFPTPALTATVAHTLVRLA